MSDKKNNNNLEDFVQQNREAFDDAIPNLKIWTKIENGLDHKTSATKPQSRKVWQNLRIAAAIVFLLSLGGVIGNFIGQEQRNPDNASSELVEIEAFYQKQVSEKYAQFTKTSNDKSVEADLAQIDEFMKELKADMINQVPGTKEKIISNLIKNYQLKINILERVLERVEENTQEQNNKKNVQISL